MSDLPRWAQRNGIIRRKDGLLVCKTCGGNCGQCGITGRIQAENDGKTPPADMEQIASHTSPGFWATIKERLGL